MGMVTLTFDFETGMRVASKVGNLPSKFGHAIAFWFSNYSLCTRRMDRQTDRQTDGRTDKSNAYCPLPNGREHNKKNKTQLTELLGTNSHRRSMQLRQNV